MRLRWHYFSHTGEKRVQLEKNPTNILSSISINFPMYKKSSFCRGGKAKTITTLLVFFSFSFLAWQRRLNPIEVCLQPNLQRRSLIAKCCVAGPLVITIIIIIIQFILILTAICRVCLSFGGLKCKLDCLHFGQTRFICRKKKIPS